MRILLFTTLLFYTSADNSHALSNYLPGRVFFVDRTTVFVGPNARLSSLVPGDSVAVTAPDGTKRGEGIVFRVWPDHITVQLWWGEAGAGDFVEPLKAAAVSRLAPGGTPVPQRLLVAGIRDGPDYYAEEFNADFLSKLASSGLVELFAAVQTRETGAFDPQLQVVMLDSARPWSLRELGRRARHLGAGWFIVPRYIASREIQDMVSVEVYNAEDGVLLNRVFQPARLFPNYLVKKSGIKVGGLSVETVYAGLDSATTNIEYTPDGTLNAVIRGEVFTLGPKILSYAGTWSGPRPRRVRTELENGFSVRVERGTEPDDPGRVLIYDGEALVFSSPPFPDLIEVASYRNTIAILYGSTVEEVTVSDTGKRASLR